MSLVRMIKSGIKKINLYIIRYILPLMEALSEINLRLEWYSSIKQNLLIV